MTDRSYRVPTAEERAFLRIVTRGYRELEAQIENCEIAEYDPSGYCDIRVVAGPPSPMKDRCDGPSLLTDGVNETPVEIILWISNDGMLDTIEVVEYGGRTTDIYRRFIDAARDATLSYKN